MKKVELLAIILMVMTLVGWVSIYGANAYFSYQKGNHIIAFPALALIAYFLKFLVWVKVKVFLGKMD